MSSGRPSESAVPQRLWRLSSWLLSNAAIPGSRLVASEFARSGMRRDQYAVLAVLAEFGPVSQANLGRRLSIDRSDIAAVLNELEHGGLARRDPDERDRRRNAISITRAGSRLLTKLDARVTRAQDAVLEPLSDNEREDLDRLLRRLVEHHRPGSGPA
jgi:MarR family transcriptional regulator, lower aerobic nicotinate degradation pathway regulator